MVGRRESSGSWTRCMQQPIHCQPSMSHSALCQHKQRCHPDQYGEDSPPSSHQLHGLLRYRLSKARFLALPGDGTRPKAHEYLSPYHQPTPPHPTPTIHAMLATTAVRPETWSQSQCLMAQKQVSRRALPDHMAGWHVVLDPEVLRQQNGHILSIRSIPKTKIAENTS